ncbi:hypothetical protein V6X63_10300 [Spiribacter sp. 221]|uniref:hypothetical protein n=1 Tax=Spiribacter onubensis TaxID=3122420 RepID=UPI00349F919B
MTGTKTNRGLSALVGTLAIAASPGVLALETFDVIAPGTYEINNNTVSIDTEIVGADTAITYNSTLGEGVNGLFNLTKTDWWGDSIAAESLAYRGSSNLFYAYDTGGYDGTTYVKGIYDSGSPGSFDARVNVTLSNAIAADEDILYATQAVPEIDGAALAQGVLAIGALGLWIVGGARRLEDSASITCQ